MSHDGWCSPKIKQLFLRILNIPSMTQVSLLFGLGNFCTVLFIFNVGVTSRVSRPKIKLIKIKIITFRHADHQQLSFRIFFNSDKYYFGIYAINVGKYESGIVNLCHSKENTSWFMT